MEYTSKDKLNITEEFIEELTGKSWQEIEHLQNQLTNLADTTESKKVKKLLSNLLTSYYVFVGGLENLDVVCVQEQPIETANEPIAKNTEAAELNYSPAEMTQTLAEEPVTSEPFEYFVDFDDPVGEPLTDKDLYND